MGKIALATAVAALTAASLATGRAEAQSPAAYLPPPGAAPPWANTATKTETPPAPAPTAKPAPAAIPASTSAAPPAADPPGTATPVPIAATPSEGTTTPRQVVSLRSGPNSSFPVIGTLRPGMSLRILATANYGWKQVETPQGTGWAYGSYLASGTGAATPENTAAAPESPVSASEIRSP